MDEQKLAEMCGPSINGVYMARTQEGELYIRKNGEWERFDFNLEYRGYYSPCQFTKIEYLAEQFYLAGVDSEGAPQLFVSLMGSVWEKRNIDSYHPLYGSQYACGCIIEMLYDETVRQVFLITDRGQLLVLPECPKCVRIVAIEPDAVGGWLEDGQINILFSNQSVQQVSVAAAAQFRVAMSHMYNRLQAGAWLVDVRSEERQNAHPIAGSISVPAEEITSWLQGQDIEQEMYFICTFGTQADRAAECARRAGFGKAYSVGGINPIAHVS